MKQKIEWYREVLDIEPNSKIFFPLSRMLAKEGNTEEAISILRQGVGRHPDHIEARLFLVELLYNADRAVELQQEISVLSDLFKNYPGFWRAWGERLFADNNTKDAGLAAIFLAAFLQNIPVSWAGIIEHGLKSLVGNGPQRSNAAAFEAHPLAPQTVPVHPKKPPVPTLSGSVTPASPNHTPTAEIRDPDASEDDENEEPITLRTRSMADILAEQGDITGALDIYNELLSTASFPEEKSALQQRIEILSSKALPDASAPDLQGQEQDGKKDWLAILAQRLEARSIQ